MGNCTYLDLLVIFYINVLKMQGSGTIFHQTEMNDWLLEKSKFVKMSKFAQVEDMQD